jgi:pyruvate formate lyase activating enzyme
MGEKKDLTGIVFNVQRFSIHDGPGIRTTVFLKGCNIKCAWCHNPESIMKRPQISIDYNLCNSCGKCAEACPNDVHKFDMEGRHQINTEACSLSLACLKECPESAITVIGKEYTPMEVIELINEDRIYYEPSGGGVTFSGGEPTLQHDFLLSLLKLAKKEQLHVCLDTNGMITESHLLEISHYVDLFLFDFKHYDDLKHKEYTGVSNRQIFKNLEFLNQLEKPIILRCPIIPGINDTSAHFEAIRLLKQKYNEIREVELMPYHETGAGKWENLGYTYTLSDVKAPKKEQVEVWKRKVGLV